jgi:hypothetical protein
MTAVIAAQVWPWTQVIIFVLACAVITQWALEWHRERRTPPPPPPAPTPSGELTGTDRHVLDKISRIKGTRADLATAARFAASMRLDFPDLSDVQICRILLRARWVVLREDESGANVALIVRVLGLMAADLASLEMETTPQ